VSFYKNIAKASEAQKFKNMLARNNYEHKQTRGEGVKKWEFWTNEFGDMQKEEINGIVFYMERSLFRNIGIYNCIYSYIYTYLCPIIMF